MITTILYRGGSRFLLCLLLLLQPPMALAIDTTNLPDLGNSAESIMTPAEERRLGQTFMRSVRKSLKLINDPTLSDYIEDLGRRLLENSTARGEHFHFFLVDSQDINAFAGPGGNIGIHTGLLLTTDTESELAAVVAHEIAHVTQRHLLRTWETASRLGVTQAALLLAAILVGATVGGDAAMAAAVGGQAALLQNQINFTRTNEQEADRVGIAILADAGFETRAMPSFFSRMGNSTRAYASKLPEFLRTHPVTTNRIADSLGRAEQHTYRQNANDLRYQLARAALREMAIDDPGEAEHEFASLLRDGRYHSEAATRYGRAQALLRARRNQDALAELGPLLAQSPDTVEFIVAMARAEAAAGRPKAALERLHQAIVEQPASYALNMVYARLALEHGAPTQAETTLEYFKEYRTEDPQLYYLLARTNGALKKELQGHEYMSRYYYLLGETEQAITQLEIALKLRNISFYDASRLDSQLADLRRERDAEDPDKRREREKQDR